MRIKKHTGFVFDVDWQKVAFGYSITAAAQSYALRKFNQLSGKLADERSVKAIKIAGQDLNKEITDWLSV